jgi:D-alanyl-D-alanine carboxypeptidase
MGTPADETEYSDALRQCWAELGIPFSLITERGLPTYAEAVALAIAEQGHDGREHMLVPAAAQAWSSMKSAAADQHISIHIVSAHRSVARQIEIIERKLAAGQTPEQIFAVSAPPGCSEHHTGRAVDVGTVDSPALEIEFDNTPAFRWLSANADRFGFALTYPPDNPWGYAYEPWHWCYQEG